MVPAKERAWGGSANNRTVTSDVGPAPRMSALAKTWEPAQPWNNAPTPTPSKPLPSTSTAWDNAPVTSTSDVRTRGMSNAENVMSSANNAAKARAPGGPVWGAGGGGVAVVTGKQQGAAAWTKVVSNPPKPSAASRPPSSTPNATTSPPLPPTTTKEASPPPPPAAAPSTSALPKKAAKSTEAGPQASPATTLPRAPASSWASITSKRAQSNTPTPPPPPTPPPNMGTGAAPNTNLKTPVPPPSSSSVEPAQQADKSPKTEAAVEAAPVTVGTPPPPPPATQQSSVPPPGSWAARVRGVKAEENVTPAPENPAPKVQESPVESSGSDNSSSNNSNNKESSISPSSDSAPPPEITPKTGPESNTAGLLAPSTGGAKGGKKKKKNKAAAPQGQPQKQQQQQQGEKKPLVPATPASRMSAEDALDAALRVVAEKASSEDKGGESAAAPSGGSKASGERQNQQQQQQLDLHAPREAKATEEAGSGAPPQGGRHVEFDVGQRDSSITTASDIAEIRKAVSIKDFELLCMIGKGAFGKVFQVRSRVDGKVYAMKGISKRFLKRKNWVSSLKAERDILTKVQHPFIVSLQCSFQTSEKLYLVMKFLAGGELFFHLTKDGLLLEDVAVFYTAEILLALEFLHSMNIIHRDLKPENVLLDGEGHVQLTDFGLSKELREESEDGRVRTVCGSNEYMAPEMISRKGYGKPADWWSMGALVYEMMVGRPPFRAKTNKDLNRKILNEKVKVPSWLSPQAHSLIKGLLERNVSKRLGCAKSTMFKIGGVREAMDHKFFRHIDWQRLEKRQVVPPIQPVIEADTDTTYFDEEFTSMSIPRSAHVDEPDCSVGGSTCPSSVAGDPLGTQDDKDLFYGFSFISP
eukprot:CAMPEP_0113935822 /NCGR_PEP_ID=MMETSP1339-20121228/2886_1 /TAXON_ID=94617 /ORGANISM="Fibrocapsa japonica" /LENGTH=866 /DNA_ID=CAMNT_0000938097 /DNA_START=60 /DNA_END=2656 /DNA_ORIENTATION=- /assembly_acc=CAM_ASM_000762